MNARTNQACLSCMSIVTDRICCAGLTETDYQCTICLERFASYDPAEQCCSKDVAQDLELTPELLMPKSQANKPTKGATFPHGALKGYRDR